MAFFEGLKGLRFRHQRLLTVTELAGVLKVPPSWIYQKTMLGQKGLPHVKVGKYLRFDVQKVMEFLQKQS